MKCHFCNNDSRDYFLFWPVSNPHYCAVCGPEKKLCSNHRYFTVNYNLSQSGYGNKYDLCPDCMKWREDAVSKIIAVRSSHIGKHDIIKITGHCETRYKHKNMDDAAWEIKYNAALVGANAVLNIKLISHEAHYGNYIYKEWTATGDHAIVKERK